MNIIVWFMGNRRIGNDFPFYRLYNIIPNPVPVKATPVNIIIGLVDWLMNGL